MIGEVTSNDGNSNTLPVKANRAGSGGKDGLHGHDEQNRTFTRVERKVLEAITNPDLVNATATDRIKWAGVSRNRYYAVLNDAWFERKHREFVRAMVQQRVGAFVNASADTASTPGRDGFNDRRMLLEMSGHYVPRSQQDIHIQAEAVIAIAGVDPTQI